MNLSGLRVQTYASVNHMASLIQMRYMCTQAVVKKKEVLDSSFSPVTCLTPSHVLVFTMTYPLMNGFEPSFRFLMSSYSTQ